MASRLPPHVATRELPANAHLPEHAYSRAPRSRARGGGSSQAAVRPQMPHHLKEVAGQCRVPFLHDYEYDEYDMPVYLPFTPATDAIPEALEGLQPTGRADGGAAGPGGDALAAGGGAGVGLDYLLE
eukprot:7064699-Prymnesium_polylepis.2